MQTHKRCIPERQTPILALPGQQIPAGDSGTSTKEDTAEEGLGKETNRARKRLVNVLGIKSLRHYIQRLS